MYETGGSEGDDKGTGITWEPKAVLKESGRGYKYLCPDASCTHPPMGSINGMRGHIQRTHLKAALLCEYCPYSAFNPDVLTQHINAKHK